MSGRFEWFSANPVRARIKWIAKRVAENAVNSARTVRISGYGKREKKGCGTRSDFSLGLLVLKYKCERDGLLVSGLRIYFAS